MTDIEARIVVIEDEPGIALPLTDRLRREGFEVHHAADGPSGLAAARRQDTDLVVLDLMLPGMNGSDVLRALRDGGGTTPVICLTARTAEKDRVQHLVAGADDYVTKPFSTDELVARIRAVLRRAGTTGEAAAAPDGPIEIGDLTIDLDGHTVERGGERARLSTLEAAILSCLLKRRGRATPRPQILDEVWGRYAAVTDRTIDFHVKNLRRKLERNPEKPELIVTDHGIGYRFAAG